MAGRGSGVRARGCEPADSLELNPLGHIWDTSQREMPVTGGQARVTKPQVNGHFCRNEQVATSPFSHPRLQAGSLRTTARRSDEAVHRGASPMADAYSSNPVSSATAAAVALVTAATSASSTVSRVSVGWW